MFSLPEMYLVKKIMCLGFLKRIQIPDFPQLPLKSLYDGMSKYSKI